MKLQRLAFPDYSACPESTLVAQARAGEHDAFTELMNRNRARLYTIMLRASHSSDLAEEIVQDTFVQAFIKLHTFRSQSAFSTWIYRIAFNKHSTLKRRHRATRSLEGLCEGGGQDPVDPHISAENLCLRAEAKLQVTRALARLDAQTRRILILREMQGLSYDEISQVMRIKLGTVRSRLSRARARLAQELGSKALNSH